MGCKSQVTIDYGTSALYTKEDMDEAIQLIRQEFDTWTGCELHSIRYTSDDNCNDKNLTWMNDLAEARGEDQTFTQCIFFESSFIPLKMIKMPGPGIPMRNTPVGNGAWPERRAALGN